MVSPDNKNVELLKETQSPILNPSECFQDCSLISASARLQLSKKTTISKNIVLRCFIKISADSKIATSFVVISADHQTKQTF